MIYSNYKLGESDVVKPGKENHVPSYQLMNAACSLIGTEKTALMSFLSQYKRAVPYFNSRLGLTVDDHGQWYVDAHRYVTYDIVFGEKYFEDRFK